MATEIVNHTLTLFLYETPARAADDAKMRNLLQFIESHITVISEMGIKMNIRKYTSKQLTTDKLLLKRLQDEKTTFPSVRTPAKTYTGFDDIQKLYIVNIENFKKYEHKQEKPVPGVVGGSSEGELEDYMQAAIAPGNDEDDEESESLSGGKGLTSKHSAAMQARNANRPSKPVRGVAPLRESDNVKANRESIQQTISRLSTARNPQQNETGGIRGGGFTDSGGGDGDDAESSRDDLLLRKRQEDNEDSLPARDD